MVIIIAITYFIISYYSNAFRRSAMVCERRDYGCIYKLDALYIIYPSPVKFEFKLCIRSSSYTGPDRVGENGYIVITHSSFIYVYIVYTWELYTFLVLSG